MAPVGSYRKLLNQEWVAPILSRLQSYELCNLEHLGVTRLCQATFICQYAEGKYEENMVRDNARGHCQVHCQVMCAISRPFGKTFFLNNSGQFACMFGSNKIFNFFKKIRFCKLWKSQSSSKKWHTRLREKKVVKAKVNCTCLLVLHAKFETDLVKG